MPRAPKNKQPKGYRLTLALQLFDTANPRLSIRECERISGLKHPALLNALRRREKLHQAQCPTCGYAPGQKVTSCIGETLQRARADTPDPTA